MSQPQRAEGRRPSGKGGRTTLSPDLLEPDPPAFSASSLYCKSGDSNDPPECSHEVGQKMGEGRCFLYKGRPAEEQVSYIPASAKEVEWWSVPQDLRKSWPDGRPTTQ